MEVSPPLPLESADEREKEYGLARKAELEMALRQKSLYRQEYMEELFEVQTRANLFSELEVLRFRHWADSHGTQVMANRQAVITAADEAGLKRR